MAQSVPQRTVVNQGSWWLLAIAGICAGLSMIGSTGVPAIVSLVLTLWFGVGTLVVLLKQNAPPRRIFLFLLLIVVLLALYVSAMGHPVALVPAAIAFGGLYINLIRWT